MTMTNNKKFTLTEMLVVISIIIILAAIGVKSYKKIAGEASLHIAAAGIRQIINNSIKTGKRYNVPIQLLKFVPDNTDTKPTVLYGTSSSSLVAYWGFEGSTKSQANVDFKGNQLIGDPTWTDGQMGMCFEFSGETLTHSANATTGTASMKNFYMEVAFKMSPMSAGTSGTILKYGNLGIGFIVDSVGNSANLFGTQNTSTLAVADDIPNGSSNERPIIPFDDSWHTAGIAYSANVVTSVGFQKDTATADVSFFIDGKYIGMTKGVLSSVDDIQISDTSFRGKIDEVKVFNYRRGSSYTPDLKNVFLTGTSASSVMSSGEWTASHNAYVPLLDAGGNQILDSDNNITTSTCTVSSNNVSQIMNSNLHSSIGIPLVKEGSELNNTTLEYTVGSQIIKGTVKTVNASANTVEFNSSSTLSSLPPSGYLLIDGELVHYSHFTDAKTVKLDQRTVGGTPGNASDNDTFYLAMPIFINTDGSVK